MALHKLKFEVRLEKGASIINAPAHIGVVGSGDMEVMIEPKALDGGVEVQIVTPVTGFDALWKRVLESFITEVSLANASIEINDNNATPSVVMLRLHQAFNEAQSN